MNVDTGELQALREQAAAVDALGRKVSALTGRVSVLGNYVRTIDRHVDDSVLALCRTILWQADRLGEAPARKPARHAAPKGKRHLRPIDGGKP